MDGQKDRPLEDVDVDIRKAGGQRRGWTKRSKVEDQWMRRSFRNIMRNLKPLSFSVGFLYLLVGVLCMLHPYYQILSLEVLLRICRFCSAHYFKIWLGCFPCVFNWEEEVVRVCLRVTGFDKKGWYEVKRVTSRLFIRKIHKPEEVPFTKTGIFFLLIICVGHVHAMRSYAATVPSNSSTIDKEGSSGEESELKPRGLGRVTRRLFLVAGIGKPVLDRLLEKEQAEKLAAEAEIKKKAEIKKQKELNQLAKIVLWIKNVIAEALQWKKEQLSLKSLPSSPPNQTPTSSAPRADTSAVKGISTGHQKRRHRKFSAKTPSLARSNRLYVPQAQAPVKNNNSQVESSAKSAKLVLGLGLLGTGVVVGLIMVLFAGIVFRFHKSWSKRQRRHAKRQRLVTVDENGTGSDGVPEDTCVLVSEKKSDV